MYHNSLYALRAYFIAQTVATALIKSVTERNGSHFMVTYSLFKECF